ncbi:unnamed protein product, partial [Scytosiphon promiscuus]
MREELARLLDGLTGTVRLSNADSRWESLLRCGSRVLGLSLSEEKVLDFCDAMLRNNPNTGNFGSLVALTVATVDQAVSTAYAVAAAAAADRPGGTTFSTAGGGGAGGIGAGVSAAAAAAQHSPEGFPRALAALRLTRLFAARMVSNLDASQLRSQFYSRGKRLVDGDGGGGAAEAGVPPAAAEAAAAAGGTPSGSGISGGSGGGGAAITEGREEDAEERTAVATAAVAPTDPVVGLLGSIMALLCATNEEGREGFGAGTPRRSRGRARGSGGGVLAVEGFSDLQLEGVGLLLVLLGTQVYGPPPPPPSAPSPSARNSSPRGRNGEQRTAGTVADNVFLDALLREASSGSVGRRSRGWGVALPRAVLGWFIRRPAAPPGSVASALVNALQAPPPSASSRRGSTAADGRRHRRGASTSTDTSSAAAVSSSSSSSAALVLPTTVDAADGSAGMTAEARRLLVAYPGALVLLFARALLYVVTLRGLMGAVGGAGSGSGSSLLRGGDADCEGEGGFEEDVTEAPGGAPKEPGEWEGHRSKYPRKVSPLADRGVLLLLVLLRNRARTNPFRAAVASCVDAELDDNLAPESFSGGGGGFGGRAGSAAGVSAPSSSSAPAATPVLSSPSAAAAAPPMRVSFRGLFEAFATTLESLGREGVALLLYSLLQANPGFLRAAVIRSDADALLLPLLRTLHDGASTEQQQQQQQQKKPQRWVKTVGSAGAGSDPSPPALYVPAIVVLLFSQDAAFNRQSFRQVVQGEVRWGGSATRNLKGATLGSLVVMSILRCLGHNLKRLKDGYLLENCLAVLVNLAPQAEHLQAYAAERLVSVLIAASRRDVQELCGEVARVLFLFVWTCTRPRRLGGNVELLYALLHEQVSLDAICSHPALAATGWAGDLPRLLAHFQGLARQREE